MRRGGPGREWDAAIEKCRDEGQCRYCGIQANLQAAHTIKRQYDERVKPGSRNRRVNPDGVIPLCAHCHDLQERGEISILGVLSLDEQLYAVARLGTIEAARRRLDPLDYHRAIEAARVEVREALL